MLAMVLWKLDVPLESSYLESFRGTSHDLTIFALIPIVV
jgi:hypothetical protein